MTSQSHPHPQPPRPHQKSLNLQKYPGPKKPSKNLKYTKAPNSSIFSGRYPDAEIMNLWRFIAGMKFRPLFFRNTYPTLNFLPIE